MINHVVVLSHVTHVISKEGFVVYDLQHSNHHVIHSYYGVHNSVEWTHIPIVIEIENAAITPHVDSPSCFVQVLEECPIMTL